MIQTLHGDALAKELHRRADELVKLAEGVSNLRKPESDNNFGREAMVLRAAACEIDTLVYKLDAVRKGLNDVLYRNQNDQAANADTNAMSEVHELFYQWFQREQPK